MLTAILSSLAVCAGLGLFSTPAEAYRANPSDILYRTHRPKLQTAAVQPGQQFPWFNAGDKHLYADFNEDESSFDDATLEQIDAWFRIQRGPEHELGSLFGAKYKFQAVNKDDRPTRETAPRFFEWDPAGKNGATRAAHALLDRESFTRAHQELSYPNSLIQQGTKRRYLMVNEHSWADGLAALSLFDQTDIGDALLINGPTHLDPFNNALLARKSSDKHGVDVTFVGGPTALNEELKSYINGLKAKVNRVAGPSRVETMIAAARTAKQFDKEASDVGGLSPREDHKSIRITRGYAPEGSNPSAAYADFIGTRSLNRVSLLTTSETLHPATAEFLKKESPFGACQYGYEVDLIGGHAALSPEVERAINELDCIERDDRLYRLSGASRFHTNIDDIHHPWKHDAPERSTVFPSLAGLLVVDGEAADMWQVAIPLKMAFPYFNIVYVQGDNVPEYTASHLKAFGHSYRLINQPIWFAEPPIEDPAYTTRTVMCYASPKACGKVRDLMNNQDPIDGMPLITDDPARPLKS